MLGGEVLILLLTSLYDHSSKPRNDSTQRQPGRIHSFGSMSPSQCGHEQILTRCWAVIRKGLGTYIGAGGET
jgi:hypothetical protein